MKVRTVIQGTGKTAAGIHLPADVVEALGQGRRPPVRATINGYTWRSTIAVMGGEYWLGVSNDVRAQAGVEAGQEVDLELEVDTEKREVVVPADFAAALDGDPGARAFFDGLSYSNRRVFTLSVEGTNNPETKARRVEKAIALMHEGRVR